MNIWKRSKSSFHGSRHIMDELSSLNAHNKELDDEIILSMFSGMNNPNMNQELVHIIKTVSSVNNHKKMKVEEIYQVLQKTRNSCRRHKHVAHSRGANSMQIAVKPHAEAALPFSRTKVTVREQKHLKYANNKRNKSSPFVKAPKSPNKTSCKRLTDSENGNRSEIYFYNVQKSTSLSKSYKPILLSNEMKKTFPEEMKRPCVFNQEKHLGRIPTNLDGSNPFDVERILSEIFHSVSFSDNKSHQPMQSSEISREDSTIHKKFDSSENIDRAEQNSSDDDSADRSFNDSFLNECEWTFERGVPPNILNEENSIKLSTMFEKVKGDERDLPSIYSRFVRKSKCTSSIISDSGMRTNRKYRDPQLYSEIKYPFKESHNYSKEYILGELVKDELLDSTFSEAADKQLEYDEIILEAKETATLALKNNKKKSSIEKEEEYKKKTIAKRSKYKFSPLEKPKSHKNFRRQSAESIQLTNPEIESSLSMNIPPSHAITMILLTADKLKQ